MSGFEKFKADVEASEELAQRFGELAKGIAAEDGELSPAEVQVRAAAEMGYDLDVAELEMAAAAAAELNEGELERVAGGLMPQTSGDECVSDLWTGKVEHCWGTSWGCVTFLWN